MERPLEDTTTAMLWKTLFATIVELGLRSGLFTENELTPPLVAPTGSEMSQPHEHSQEVASRGRMEDGTDDQELGEESEHEEDPLQRWSSSRSLMPKPSQEHPEWMPCGQKTLVWLLLPQVAQQLLCL